MGCAATCVLNVVASARTEAIRRVVDEGAVTPSPDDRSLDPHAPAASPARERVVLGDPLRAIAALGVVGNHIVNVSQLETGSSLRESFGLLGGRVLGNLAIGLYVFLALRLAIGGAVVLLVLYAALPARQAAPRAAVVSVAILLLRRGGAVSRVGRAAAVAGARQPPPAYRARRSFRGATEAELRAWILTIARRLARLSRSPRPRAPRERRRRRREQDRL